MVLAQFLEILRDHCWMGKKMVLGVSGGPDSMVMAHLFLKAGNPFVVAHANYGLRGDASEADEALVADWCRQNGIQMFSRRFALKDRLEREGGNLQELARQQRYEWFESIRQQMAMDFVAVAHHEDDSRETLLLHFFKGTGIAGMHGILPRQGTVIRPLLSFSRQELLAFATRQELPWRTDESNLTNDYLRNRIRNQLFPILTELFPNVRRNLSGNMRRLREAEQLYQQSIDRYRKKLIRQQGSEVHIPVAALRNCQPLATIFYELLRPYGFSARQLPDLLHLLTAESGKFVSSKTHRIVRDRRRLLITPLPTRHSRFLLIEAQPDRETIECPDFVLQKSMLRDQPPGRLLTEALRRPEEAFIDMKQLSFPLICRPWRQGDYFYPLGLGKKKKISRFLIDQKMALPAKEKIWVLESRKKIVWILGLRLDDRFKIKDSTKDIIHFSIS